MIKYQKEAIRLMDINAAAMWINSTFSGFDEAVTLLIHNLYNIAGGFFTPFFEFISFLGYNGFLLILLSFLLIVFKKTRRFGTAMLIGLAIGAFLTNCCLKILIARPRPFSDENIRNISFISEKHIEKYYIMISFF